MVGAAVSSIVVAVLFCSCRSRSVVQLVHIRDAGFGGGRARGSSAANAFLLAHDGLSSRVALEGNPNVTSRTDTFWSSCSLFVYDRERWMRESGPTLTSFTERVFPSEFVASHIFYFPRSVIYAAHARIWTEENYFQRQHPADFAIELGYFRLVRALGLAAALHQSEGE